MQIFVFDRQQALEICEKQVKQIVKNVLELECFTCDEVSIHFVGVEEISKLHSRFFNDPSSTDCITLPIDPPKKCDTPNTRYCVLGESFVCPQVAIQYVEQSKILNDPYRETTLYLVHSLLHLLGYKDKTEKEQKQMREAEKKHMQALDEKKLLLHYKKQV